MSNNISFTTQESLTIENSLINAYSYERIHTFVMKHGVRKEYVNNGPEYENVQCKFDFAFLEFLESFGEVHYICMGLIIVLSEKYKSVIRFAGYKGATEDNRRSKYKSIKIKPDNNLNDKTNTHIDSALTIRSDSYENITIIRELFDKEFEKYKITSVNKVLNMNWWYSDKNKGIETKSLSSEYNDIIHNEAYPYIDDMNKYIDEYINSSENVLLLKGPPGTGKSRFLRYLLSRMIDSDKGFNFTTSEEVITDNNIYMNSLENNMPLVMEDIDFHLKSRKENNQVMYSLLNISDGIFTNKNKIIISTNLTSLSSIDEAFLRPGRCFDILEFRRLTSVEAKVLLCKLDDKNKNIDLTHTDYSIAEIYSINHNGIEKKHTDTRKDSVGFKS